MKAVALFKKEIMQYNVFAYALWITCMMSGCIAFLNPPMFIIDLHFAGILHFLQDAFKISWGVFIAFIMAFVAVIANKAATKWWDERGKLLYERFFPSKKKPS